MESIYGLFAANGNDMLRIREQEIGAIGKMADMKKSKEFAEAAKKVLEGLGWQVQQRA